MSSDKPGNSKIAPVAAGNGHGEPSPAKPRPEPPASGRGSAYEKSSERADEFTTIPGYPIRRLYTEADLANWNPESELGAPGAPPYTRGIHPSMYRERLWTIRQFAGFGSAHDTNA